MTKYLYLNPVTYNNLIENNIDSYNYFHDLGFKLLDIPTHIFDEIREEYAELSQKSDCIILDSRCPELRRLLEDKYPKHLDKLADIDPIFIRTAKYFIKKYLTPNNNAELYMISPCTQLCKMEKLSNRVYFLTWKDFKRVNNLNLTIDKPKSTPLPMGFFDGLNLKSHWAKGSNIDKINSIINDNKDGIRIIEYLYCNGCHNGDGL